MNFKTQADIYEMLLDGKKLRSTQFLHIKYFHLVDGHIADDKGCRVIENFSKPSEWSIYEEPKPLYQNDTTTSKTVFKVGDLVTWYWMLGTVTEICTIGVRVHTKDGQNAIHPATSLNLVCRPEQSKPKKQAWQWRYLGNDGNWYIESPLMTEEAAAKYLGPHSIYAKYGPAIEVEEDL